MRKRRVGAATATFLAIVAPAVGLAGLPLDIDAPYEMRWAAPQNLVFSFDPERIAALDVVVTPDDQQGTVSVPLIIEGRTTDVEAVTAEVDLPGLNLVEVVRVPVAALAGKAVSGGLVNIVRHGDSGELFSSVAGGFDLTALSSDDGGSTYTAHVIDDTRDYFGNNTAIQGDTVKVGGVEATTFSYRIYAADADTKVFATDRVVDDPDSTFPISDESVGFPPNRLTASLSIDVAFLSRRTSANTADLFYSCSNGDEQVFDTNIPRVSGAILGGHAITVGSKFLYAYARSGTDTVRLVETECDSDFRVWDVGTFMSPGEDGILGVGLSALSWAGEVGHVVWQGQSRLVDLREDLDPPRFGFDSDGFRSLNGFPSLRTGPVSITDFEGGGNLSRPYQIAFTFGSLVSTFLVDDVVRAPAAGGVALSVAAAALLLFGAARLGRRNPTRPDRPRSAQGRGRLR